jgi:autotransporter family porin
VTTSVSVTSGGTLTIDTQVLNAIPSFTLDSGSATFGQGASFQQATISNSTFKAGAVNGGAVTFGVDPNSGTPLSGAASTITGGTLALNGLTVEPTTSLTISGASGELDAVGAFGALDVTGHSNLTVSKVSGSATLAVGPQGLLTVENGSKLTESGGRVGVNGALKILSGGVLTDDGASVAAALNGPPASATVDGSGSLWSVNGSLNIGSGIPSTQVALPGSVTVEAGGTLKVTGAIDIGVGAYSQGTLTINGTGSKLTANLSQVVIGGAGSGTLRLQNGASLDFSSVPAVQLGTSAAGSGTIVVDSGSTGPVSQAQFAALDLGAAGKGELDLQNNGRAVVNGDLTIGLSGSGTLLVTSNANLTVNSVTTIGENAGSAGQATVSDGGTWNAQDVNVGPVGSGSLKIDNGGMTVGALTVGGGNQSATVTITNNGVFDATGILLEGSASMTVSNGGRVRDGNSDAAPLTFVVGGVGSASLTIDGGHYGDAGSDSSEGAASTSSAGDLSVAKAGSVTIENNGAMTTGNAEVDGTVALSGGASWNVGNLQIGKAAGPASVTVQGSTLRLNPSLSDDVDSIVAPGLFAFTVGAGAQGALNISNGGAVVLEGASLELGVGGTGVVDIGGGGSLQLARDAGKIGGVGVGSGQLTVEKGGSLTADYLDVGSNGSASVNGTAALSTALEIANGGSAIVAGGGDVTSGGYVTVGRGSTLNVRAGSIEIGQVA